MIKSVFYEYDDAIRYKQSLDGDNDSESIVNENKAIIRIRSNQDGNNIA